MAMIILTYRIMPESGEIEYSELEKVSRETIEGYDSSVKIKSVEEYNVGFGLKAVKVYFSMDEKKGSDELEEKLRSLEQVGEVVIESMSRALG